MRQRDVQTLCDSEGFEILVDRTVTRMPAQIEECHGYHDVGSEVEVEIHSIELVFVGRGIPLTMDAEQDRKLKQLIIENI